MNRRKFLSAAIHIAVAAPVAASMPVVAQAPEWGAGIVSMPSTLNSQGYMNAVKRAILANAIPREVLFRPEMLTTNEGKMITFRRHSPWEKQDEPPQIP